ncbi:NAD(P)H-dependent oxidoreductase [Nodosilinea sp. FACHB-131]|uniref:NADPH-dependent FMN reductase n=1 Tax=Cyanophyceae TaxID=3028117 RepID=UPI00168A133F|nr:NAD(P)H-dependent oxidoreductase [Nodosilinea sp. FACHB-131]MBD1874530.1 NAD(P)H-dependent oxidoreductase [Nodosilinea sp. FACHB-131]
MLILSATNGKNLDLAHAFAAEATNSGVAAEVISLPELQIPLYDSLGSSSAGDGLLKLAQAMRQHKSLVICAPEYNGSIPPVLSNAIAWLSVSTDDFRALFNSRPVALATHSGGGGQKVMLAIRQQLSHLGCTVLGREVQSSSQKAANPEAIAALVSQLAALESAYESVPAQV